MAYNPESDTLEAIQGDNLKKDYFGVYDPTDPGNMAYNWRQSIGDPADKIEMHLHFIDWLIAIFCIAICFVPTLFFDKRAGRNTSEFFVSGRSVPWWLAGSSRLSTSARVK